MKAIPAMLRDLIQGMRALRQGAVAPEEAYRDSRQVVRLRCDYEVEARMGERTYQGRILDIGLGGIKLACAQTPQVGEQVALSYLAAETRARDSSVPCRVEWVRRRDRDGATYVGLTYDTSNEQLGQSWVKLLLKELGFRPERTFQRRRYLRAQGFVPVRGHDNEGVSFVGQLCDLGVQGALIDAPVPLLPGTEVHLEIGPFEELESFDALGIVAQHLPSQEQHLLGIHFESLSVESLDTLGRYLRHLLLHHWEI